MNDWPGIDRRSCNCEYENEDEDLPYLDHKSFILYLYSCLCWWRQLEPDREPLIPCSGTDLQCG